MVNRGMTMTVAGLNSEMMNTWPVNKDHERISMGIVVLLSMWLLVPVSQERQISLKAGGTVGLARLGLSISSLAESSGSSTHVSSRGWRALGHGWPPCPRLLTPIVKKGRSTAHTKPQHDGMDAENDLNSNIQYTTMICWNSQGSANFLLYHILSDTDNPQNNLHVGQGFQGNHSRWGANLAWIHFVPICNLAWWACWLMRSKQVPFFFSFDLNTEMNLSL